VSDKPFNLDELDDSQMFDLKDSDNSFGKIEISPEVLEIIASLAASEVQGVTSMRGNFAAGVAEKIGRKSHGKGVKVSLTEDGILVDVHLHMKFGVSIPMVAQLVQENIHQTLKTMTALDVKSINVHVVGIDFENSEN
jgi:uncharacterized alkaline shock family protein YloU